MRRIFAVILVLFSFSCPAFAWEFIPKGSEWNGYVVERPTVVNISPDKKGGSIQNGLFTSLSCSGYWPPDFLFFVISSAFKTKTRNYQYTYKGNEYSGTEEVVPVKFVFASVNSAGDVTKQESPAILDGGGKIELLQEEKYSSFLHGSSMATFSKNGFLGLMNLSDHEKVQQQKSELTKLFRSMDVAIFDGASLATNPELSGNWLISLKGSSSAIARLETACK